VHVGAFVGLQVRPLAIFLKANCVARLKHIAGINLGELVGIDAKDFRVAVLCGTAGQAQVTLKIKLPAGDAFRVFAYQCLLAGGEPQPVEVMPGFVAVVQTDVDRVRIVLRYGHNLHADALEPGQVARDGSIRARRRLGTRVYGIDIVVFIAVVIFCVKNVSAIAAPEISCDWALRFRSEETRRDEGLVDAFNIYVARGFPWLLKSQIFSVGRELRP